MHDPWLSHLYHLPDSKFKIRFTNTNSLTLFVWLPGARLVVDTVDFKPNGTAVLVSPTYNRSSDGKSRCLRFRYMLQGSGDKTLTIFQKTGGYREIPLWTWKRNSGQDWIYGQVPLTSITKFKVISKLWHFLFHGYIWYPRTKWTMQAINSLLSVDGIADKVRNVFCRLPVLRR